MTQIPQACVIVLKQICAGIDARPGGQGRRHGAFPYFHRRFQLRGLSRPDTRDGAEFFGAAMQQPENAPDAPERSESEQGPARQEWGPDGSAGGAGRR